MKVNRKELLTALDKVSKTAQNRSSLQGDCVLFKNSSVWGCSGEVFVKVPMIDVGEGAVHTKTLFNMLKKIKDDEVDIEDKIHTFVIKYAERSQLEVKKEKIQCDPANFPGMGESKELPEEFTENLKSALFCADKSDETNIRTGVHVNNKVIEATNGRRMYCKYLSQDVPEMVLPCSSVEKLIKNKPKAVSINDKSNWGVFVDKDGSLIGCRLLAGEYLDTSKVIPENTTQIKLPDGIVEAIERIVSLLKSGCGMYRLNCYSEEGQMKIKAEGEYGAIHESLSMSENVNFDFCANPEYFLEAVKREDTIYIADNGNTLLVKGDDFIYLIALMTKS